MPSPGSPAEGSSNVMRSVSKLVRRYSHVNWALSDQALVSCANFANGILLARYLGITEFGLFTLAWLVLEFSLNLQGTMMTTPMLSIGAKKSGVDAQRYFGAVIASHLALSAMTSAALFLGVLIYDALFHGNQYSSLALPLSVAAWAANVQYFLRRYAFVRGMPFVAFISDFCRYSIQLGTLIWLFETTEMDSEGVLLVIGCAAIFALVPGSYLLWPVKFDRKELSEMARRHWHFSKWLVPSTLLNWGVGNLFIVAAGAMLGAAAVGSMKAAQNIVGISHILMLGLENVAPISAARRYHASGGPALSRYLVRFTVLGGSAMALIIGLASIAPDFLLRVIYGSEFEGQGYLVRWWCFIYFFVFLAVPPRIGLRTLEHTRPIFLQNLYLSALSLAIFYPMITNFEIIGVMVGLSVIQVLRFGILTLSYRKRLAAIGEDGTIKR
jgi:O-antigen/teichoic acid export membrane protein